MSPYATFISFMCSLSDANHSQALITLRKRIDAPCSPQPQTLTKGSSPSWAIPNKSKFSCLEPLTGVCWLTAHVDSCDGGTNPVTVTIGGSTTVSTTNTIDADAGIDIAGITIGGGFSKTKTTTTTMSNSTTFSVPPGRQVVQVVGVNHHSQTGRVQVNFGDHVDGHFIVRACLLRKRQWS